MSLTIATINIRGLNSLNKKKYLTQFLYDNNIDIACLQEISNPFVDFPDNNFTYILNRGPTGLGTGIVLKASIKPGNIEKDETGRILKIYLKDFNIINIYGYPSGKEHNTEKRNRLFSQNLQKYLKPNEINILMGDFNAVIEKNLPGSYLWQLKHIISELKYVDCDTICNEGTENFTLITHNSKTRIDRIYLPHSVQNVLTEIKYKNYIQSDHRAVIAKIKTNSNLFTRHICPSPYWKMDTTILDDSDYEQNFKEILDVALRGKTNYSSILTWWEKNSSPQLKKCHLNTAIIKIKPIGK